MVQDGHIIIQLPGSRYALLGVQEVCGFVNITDEVNHFSAGIYPSECALVLGSVILRHDKFGEKEYVALCSYVVSCLRDKFWQQEEFHL